MAEVGEGMLTCNHSLKSDVLMILIRQPRLRLEEASGRAGGQYGGREQP